MHFPDIPLSAFRNDPWNPVIIADPRAPQPAVTITPSQERAIREVLLLASSDSRFAQKAADAIRTILLKDAAVLPFITSLNPATKVTNSGTFTLRVLGEGFDEFCKVNMQGNQQVTTMVSPTELNIQMDTMGTPAQNYSVTVINVSTQLISNAKQFTVTAT